MDRAKAALSGGSAPARRVLGGCERTKTWLGVVTALLIAASAQAAVPAFSASCSDGVYVDADRTGTVHINGEKATVKKLNDAAYEARHAGVIISIGLEAGAVASVTYTGKHGVNGLCAVTASQPAAATGTGAKASASERAGQRQFDATGNVACAMAKGHPMGQCAFGVARDGGGTATVVITRPDGRTRAIFFEKGKAVSADLSQADGDMTFSATKDGDVFKIQAGHERYEIFEAVVFGG